MDNPKLVTHNKCGDFHYFELEGIKDTYRITVIKLPNEFAGQGWYGANNHNGYYKVINEERNTNRSSNYSYSFVKHYFNGENTDYMSNRIGICKECAEDFMKCISQLVYPRI